MGAGGDDIGPPDRNPPGMTRTTLLDLQTTDSFRLYLDEVGRHPLLTKEDEIELSQAYEAGLDAQLKLADTDPDDPARPELEAVAERDALAALRRPEIRARLEDFHGAA